DCKVQLQVAVGVPRVRRDTIAGPHPELRERRREAPGPPEQLLVSQGDHAARGTRPYLLTPEVSARALDDVTDREREIHHHATHGGLRSTGSRGTAISRRLRAGGIRRPSKAWGTRPDRSCGSTAVRRRGGCEPRAAAPTARPRRRAASKQRDRTRPAGPARAWRTGGRPEPR